MSPFTHTTTKVNSHTVRTSLTGLPESPLALHQSILHTASQGPLHGTIMTLLFPRLTLQWLPAVLGSSQNPETPRPVGSGTSQRPPHGSRPSHTVLSSYWPWCFRVLGFITPHFRSVANGNPNKTSLHIIFRFLSGRAGLTHSLSFYRYSLACLKQQT